MSGAKLKSIYPGPRDTMSFVALPDIYDIYESFSMTLPSIVLLDDSGGHLLPVQRKMRLPRSSSAIGSEGGQTASAVRSSSSVAVVPPSPVVRPTTDELSGSVNMSEYFSIERPPSKPPIYATLGFLSPLVPPPVSWVASHDIIPVKASVGPALLVFPTGTGAFIPLRHSMPVRTGRSTPLVGVVNVFTGISALFALINLF